MNSMMDGTMSTQELRHITDFRQQLGMNQYQIHGTIKKGFFDKNSGIEHLKPS